jgi:phospholipid/cholesterol/gamma-HCH transport system substrate-binding protein
MEKTRQDLLLGLVFFGALGILMWATIQLTGLALLETPTERVARFPNAAGLKVGDNVFVLGSRLGQVAALDIDPTANEGDDRVKVTLILERPIEFREGYTMFIEPSGLLGGVQLQIDPGRGAAALPADAELVGKVRQGGLEAVGDLFADGAIEADIRAIVGGVRQVVDRANRGEGSLGQLITDQRLHDELLAAVGSARRSLESIEQGQGLLGRLVGDKSLGDAAADTVRRIDELLVRITNREGLLGRVISDPELADKTSRIVTDVAATTADLRAGRGTIGRLLVDDGLSARFDSAIGHIESVSRKLDDPGAGAVGALLGDEAMRERGAKIVEDLAATMSELRNGRGVLGRLVFDQEMGDQLGRVLNQVSRAIEDAREAAPVATFFSVLSGAF